MRRTALALALIITALGFGQSASAKRLPIHTVTVPSFVTVSRDRLSLEVTATPLGKPKQYYRIPAKVHEKWFQVALKNGHPAFVQYWTTPNGSPMVPDTSDMIAAATDITGQQTAPMRYDQFGSLYVTLNGGGASINLPYTAVGGGIGQTPVATSVVGIAVYNPNTGLVDMATGDANQNINVNVQVVTPTIKVIVVPNKQPYPTNTVLISQFDFAVNQATCTAVSSPSSYSGAVPNTGHYCWIVKATSGVLERVTWQSLNNMNTLVANTDVICYDNATTNTGSIVFQGSMGAGQFADFEPYGRPFVNGLVCIANHSVGTAAIDAMELEIL